MAFQASVDSTQETRDRRQFVIDAPEEEDTSQVGVDTSQEQGDNDVLGRHS